MKISQRLNQINHMIDTDQDQIWDCCCDHGLLGMKLLKHQMAKCVHFVDIVESLTQQLESKLQRHFKPEWQAARCKVHCVNVSQLRFSADNRHLVIIAGIGGDKVIEFMSAIANANPLDNLTFILCPVHHNYKLRQHLIAMGLKLIQEELVEENGRFYEIIKVSLKAELPISTVGKSQWDFTAPSHLRYLQKQLNHFRKKASANPQQYQPIFEAYSALESDFAKISGH